jgi:hypothetical protein
MAIENGESRQTGNILFRRQRKTKQKQNTICAGHHYAKTNSNKANKTRTLIQITGDRDEPNIVFMRKSYRTSQRGTQNVKTDIRTTQNLVSITDLTKQPVVNSGAREGKAVSASYKTPVALLIYTVKVEVQYFTL